MYCHDTTAHKPAAYMTVGVACCAASRTEFCDNRGHPAVDERLPVQAGHLLGGGCFHLLQPRYKQQSPETEVNTVLQPQTIQHVGKHWDLMMLHFKEAPQHQHPSVLRRKETPAVSTTAHRASIAVVGFLLAVRSVNLNIYATWLAAAPREEKPTSDSSVTATVSRELN